MRRWLAIALAMLVCGIAVARNERDTLGMGTAVFFTENLGQWNPEVRFEAQLHNGTLFLGDNGITIVLSQPTSHPSPTAAGHKMHAYRMTFAGSNGSTPTGEGKTESYSNYFIGNNMGRWHSHVGSYTAVRYLDIWEGIDLEAYTASSALKYNFIVHPGGDLGQLAIEYEGTDGVEVTSKGNLLIHTSVRDIIELKPYVYQTYGAGDMNEVKSRWRVSRTKEGNYRATVEVDDYNHSRDLVVDPVLIFSTYTGSTAPNWGTTATYDAHKNVYTAGLVFSTGYPVSLGALDSTFNGRCDVAIFKFDSSGSQRLYATYLGGSQADMPHSLYVNAFDELLVFGTTGSSDYPVTPDAYQTGFAGGSYLDYLNSGNSSMSMLFPNGSDMFISRLSVDGSQLMASTYVGGSGNDGLNYRQHYNENYHIIMQGNDSLYYNYGDGARGEIISDNLNNIYVGSTTFSTDFPTTEGSLRTNWAAGQEGVAFKMDHNLRNMLWSTYLGGTGDDAVYSIELDSSYNLLVCGGTNSHNFPVTKYAHQRTYGGGSADGFISKISSDGHHMIASTYFGSSAYDQIYFVRIGRHDDVYVFGQTKAQGNAMIRNAGYSVYGSGMLIAKFAPILDSLKWSTVFGTPGRVNLSPTAFGADICNRVYAAGWGRDFVNYNGVQWYTAGTWGMETTSNAIQDSTDGQDFYIISLDTNASTLEYATFFGELHRNSGGGDHVDGGTSRFDRQSTLYQSVCGSCGGTQYFPTTANAWSQNNLSSNCNNALFRLNINDDFPVAEFVPPETGCAPYTVQFVNTGRGSSFHWDFGDGTTSTEANPTHTYTTGGIYMVTLQAYLPGGCSEADVRSHSLKVLNNGSTTIAVNACSSPAQIGVAPHLGATYQWISGNVSDPTVSNPWVTDDGTYVLKVNAIGCTETDTFAVRITRLVDTTMLSPVSCHDTADGRFTITLGPGIDPDSLNVSITPPSTWAASTAGGRQQIVFDGLAPARTYNVSLNGYGCSYEETVMLGNPAAPVYRKDFTPALCGDSCTGWLKIEYGIGFILDTLLTALCPDTHITRIMVDGCPLVDTTVILRDHRLDNLQAWADSYEVFVGEEVRLHASVGDNLTGVSYYWTPTDDIDNPESANPLATPSDTAVCYTVEATTDDNCSRSVSVCIRCIEVMCGSTSLFIPNAFTPNDDGINDRLCFYNRGAEADNLSPLLEFHIAIFNRWGEMVYESDDVTQCWDGRYKGSRCPPGVYTYTCDIRCRADKQSNIKGDITLIR